MNNTVFLVYSQCGATFTSSTRTFLSPQRKPHQQSLPIPPPPAPDLLSGSASLPVVGVSGRFMGSYKLWSLCLIPCTQLGFFQVYLCFTGVSDGKESTCNAGDVGSVPGSERSPGGGHSSILAWRIPWTEEPGGLQSTGSQRVGHN